MPHTATLRSAFAFCTVLLLGASCPGQDMDIVVSKPAGDGNPTVRVVGLDNAPQARDDLTRLLVASDWLQPVGGQGATDYTLRAAATDRGVTLTLLRNERPSATADAPTSGILGLKNALDTVLRQTFGVPGPCSSAIAFVAAQGDVQEVCLIGMDGRGYLQLSRNGALSTEPNWSARGHSLLYTLVRNHRAETIHADLGTGTQRRIALRGGLNSGAVLSPGGGRYAVCLSQGRAVDLYLRDVQGGTPVALTSDRAVEASPCWSPDGRRICYVSDRLGKPMLHVADVARRSTQRLRTGTAEAVSPDWSPDGKRIVFSLKQDGKYVLAMIDAGGGEVTVFADGPGDWESPSWGPDSRHVVCTRTQGRSADICVVDSWYGTVIPITKPGAYSLPDWSARLALPAMQRLDTR